MPRPKKGVLRLVSEVLDHGGPGYLQFAITNICNAKCDFCGFAVDRFDPKQRRSVTLQEARAMVREGKEAEAILKAVDAVDALNAGKK